MKKILFLFLFLPVVTFAQIEIVPFAGYMFGGSINYYQGKLKLDNGLDYGGSLIIPVKQVVSLELNYTHMSSELSFDAYPSYPLYSDDNATTSTNYIQIGTIKDMTINNDKVTPFGSFSLGATWYSSDSYTTAWFFSVTAGLGVKVMFSDRVGIMLRGRLMLPMMWGGTSAYYGFGTGGSGGGLTIDTYSSFVQGDFNGGLVFVLGNN
ncbi:MAG TPA: hypothetical protein VIN10_15115 [Bacteroidales bacterium]